MSTKDQPFGFEASKDFKANCEAFLEHIKATDSDLAAILHANWDSLLGIVQQGDRNPKLRSDFNVAIGKALDALLAAKVQEKSK